MFCPFSRFQVVTGREFQHIEIIPKACKTSVLARFPYLCQTLNARKLIDIVDERIRV